MFVLKWDKIGELLFVRSLDFVKGKKGKATLHLLIWVCVSYAPQNVMNHIAEEKSFVTNPSENVTNPKRYEFYC